MHSRNRMFGSLALLTAVLATGQTAVADDVVVMPFSCAVVGGKPILTPSDETAHRIYGQRQHQKVKTCSTVDPKRCRQWATYKFDMDCGGERVPWMQVFANAAEHTKRRTWQSNGRLRVQDTRQRNKRIDNMCARNLGPSLEWNSVSEACDAASPLNAPIATVMPVGFAPMVGLDAAFLPEDALTPPSQRGALARANTPTVKSARAPVKPTAEPAKPAREAANPTPEREPPQPVARSEKSDVANQTVSVKTSPTPRVTESVARDNPAKTEEAARDLVAPKLEPTISVLNKAPAAPAETAPEAPTATSNKTPALAASVTPHIVLSQSSSHAPALAVPPPAAVPDGTPPPPTATADVTPAAIAAPVETSSVASKEPDGAAPATGQLAMAPVANIVPDVEAKAPPQLNATNTDSTLAFAIGGFVVAALTMATLVINWMVNAKPIVNASTHTATAAPPVELSRDSAPARAHLPAVAAAPTTVPMHFGYANGLGDRMPSNTPEALAVLGMGVASERNLTSLKKIIDGLRMNWHPDHASDDADRLRRELRLKQINAAWEILGETRARA